MVHCPHCNHAMELKGARPGRFAPRCQQCGQQFHLTISADPNEKPVAAKIARERQAADKVPAAVAAALGIETPLPSQPKAKRDGQSTQPVHAPTAPAVMVTLAPPSPVESALANLTAAPVAVPRSESGSSAASVTAPPASDEAREARAAMSSENIDVDLNMPLDLPVSGRLGGYEIVQKLGQGGMGAVYLARQLSLDRNVAVKVLAPHLANDTSFISRFTREAYAAAQLSHHNVVQIHDIGEERNIHYFSMEFVEGRTLGSLVQSEGKIDPDVAVGFVLQAARGLRFAHEHSMIHRDIKPENLLLNEQGLVKVADLGLVKRQGQTEVTSGDAMNALARAQSANVTGAHLSMGTPAYMAPEQATDAAHVDARADIYSLGCTLYDLLTGRPPFLGKTAVEVITKHALEPVTPPDVIVKRVPKMLSVILMKMVAKKPEDRYSSMDEVIKALEDYLGQGSSGPFTPREEHAKALEIAVDQFNKSTWTLLRSKLIAAFFAACALLTVLMLYMATRDDAGLYVKMAGGIVGLAVLTFASYIVLTGITQGTHLFKKLRQFAFGARILDWARVVLFAAVLVGVLVLLDLHWVWLGFLVGAAVVATSFHFSLDLLAATQRKTPITQMEGMLKQMRMRGLDEESLRQFVCRYGGLRWEEFYETLFGYESKIQARQVWGTGERGRNRKKWGAWRDPIIAWIDARIRQRQEQKELRYLARIEERKLRAQGVDVLQARAKARRAANNLVDKAGQVKDSIEEMRSAATVAPPAASSTRPPASVVIFKPASMLDDDDADAKEERKHETYIQRKYGSIWGLLLGSQVRFLLGLGLMAGFLLWMYQTNPHFIRDLGKKSVQAVEGTHDGLSGETRYEVEPRPDIKVDLKDPQKRLSTDDTAISRIAPSGSHEGILAILGSYPAGLAGAILLISSLFRGAKMGLFMLSAAAVMILAGHAFQIPTFNLIRPERAGMIAGSVLAMLGFIFGRN